MKRRTSPPSSTRRSLRPGYCFSRSSMSPPTESAAACTSAWPLVSERSGVGIRTSTAMERLLASGSGAGFGFQIRERLVEHGQGRTDGHVHREPVIEDIGRLEPGARDADHDGLVARNAPRLDELPRRGNGDAARGLGEDALGAGEELHALDDLLVGRVLAIATRILRH